MAKDLELANEREEFALLEFLLSIAAAFPSNEYVPVLCTILNHLNPRIPNENIVSLLSKLADERALPVLKKAAYANLLSDEGRHLNRKCVWALWKIGTPKALEILKDIAVNSPFESVREDAYEAIEDFTEL
ncbi:MAG: HEAT repeat domain-containing protein [Planctomycetes bacterium]|nr:HEAT repeat domain-containing protein [Planctomycetota bacterium]